MQKYLNKIQPGWIFLALLLMIAALYNYHSIIFKRPQSTHHWRQADCASLSLMYYQNDMKFFEPQTHNLTSDGGSTGFVAPSEVPLMYYFTAILYTIFGYHDFIYRILNTLIFLLGLYYLFKLFRLGSTSVFWGIAGALLFFTSPVLAYYGNNFLTNSSSLALSIIGWYQFFLFRQRKMNTYFYWSIAVFCLACCMKISAGISLFALIAIFGFEKLRIIKFNKEPIFPKGILPWIAFFLAIAVPFSWIIYAHHYNTIHSTGYFSTGTYPLWDLDTLTIERVKNNVWNLWRSQYFNDSILILFLVLLLVQTFFAFKNDRFLGLVLCIMLLEAFVYVLLQFMTFADHDYYTIDLYIILIFTFLSTLFFVNKYKPEWLKNKILRIAFIGFLLYNVYYCKNQMRMRYEGWWNEYPAYQDFHTIKPYLRHLGIAPLDTIVTIPEYSHFIHYLTNQRGWTRYADAESPRTSEEQINEDRLFMSKCVSNGAKYLLVLDPERTLEIMPAFKKYSKYLLGTYGKVSVYATKERFITKPAPRSVLTNLVLDAEKNIENIFTEGIAIRNISENRTMEQAYSGKYAVKLTTKKQFGFTTEIKNVQKGEKFIITTLRKGIEGTLVASATKQKSFYISDQKILRDSVSGWDSLSIEFYIPHKLPKNILKLYIWYNGNDSSYFDNFRVIRKEKLAVGNGL